MCASYDAGTGDVQLYQNCTQATKSGKLTGTIDNETSNPLIIGGNRNFADPVNENFAGAIDDVRLYSGILAGTDVGKLCSGETPPARRPIYVMEKGPRGSNDDFIFLNTQDLNPPRPEEYFAFWLGRGYVLPPNFSREFVSTDSPTMNVGGFVPEAVFHAYAENQWPSSFHGVYLGRCTGDGGAGKHYLYPSPNAEQYLCPPGSTTDPGLHAWGSDEPFPGSVELLWFLHRDGALISVVGEPAENFGRSALWARWNPPAPPVESPNHPWSGRVFVLPAY